MWPKSRPRRPAGFCGKQQREKNPVRKEETRPRSMSLLSEKTCPNNGGNLRLGIGNVELARHFLDREIIKRLGCNRESLSA